MNSFDFKIITFVEKVRRSGYQTDVCCIDGACYLNGLQWGDQVYFSPGTNERYERMDYIQQNHWLVGASE